MEFSKLGSLIFYLVLFSTSTFLLYLGNKKNIKLLKFFAIIIPILIGGFRYFVGTDYTNYIDYYNVYGPMSLNEYLIKNSFFEILFYFITRVSYVFTSNYYLLFFVSNSLIVVFAVVKYKTFRIFSFLRALKTTCFPSVAADKIKMCAMSCERPAIVQCPVNFFAAGFQILEQPLDVDVISMDVVQPNHVRVIGLYLLQKGACGALGAKAMAVEHTGLHTVQAVVQRGADGQRLNIVAIRLFPAIRQQACVPLRLQVAALLRRNASRTAYPGHRIDK